MVHAAFAALFLSFAPTLATRVPQAPAAPAAAPLAPAIDGSWWQVAGNPDLGKLTDEKQQPVDFAVWQAADGTWQLWSCIRGTKCGGATRLFHRWEGRHITDADWKPMGIAMQADPALGETPGGLQAPHVFQWNGAFYMVYGDWRRICLLTSKDGKTFHRALNERGQPDLFTGPYDNTRDPMVLRIGALFHCYYMGSKAGEKYVSAVFCRTSADLGHWSEPMLVSAGGASSPFNLPGDAECPFVLEKDGWFYLFRNQLYGDPGINTQYASPNPLGFGVGDDRYRLNLLPVAAPEIVLHKGQYYIAALNPKLDGIRIAKLRWQKNATLIPPIPIPVPAAGK